MLVIIGLIPLPLGFLQNHIMMVANRLPPLLIISIAMLIIWFSISMLSKKYIKTKLETMILLNAMAIIALILNLFQEYVIGHYFMNFIGTVTQLFFLPFLSLGFALTSGISNLLSGTIYTTTFAYIAVFVCMLLVSYLGRLAGERRRN